jgi:hypothetical protein
MTQAKADLVNALLEIEDRIDELWEYHPDNPNSTNVEEEFESLQKMALVLQTQIDELGGDDEDRI